MTKAKNILEGVLENLKEKATELLYSIKRDMLESELSWSKVATPTLALTKGQAYAEMIVTAKWLTTLVLAMDEDTFKTEDLFEFTAALLKSLVYGNLADEVKVIGTKRVALFLQPYAAKLGYKPLTILLSGRTFGQK